MNFTNVADVYAYNELSREKLMSMVAEIDAETASKVPDGESWSIAHIVEHVAMVEEGIIKLCGKLLRDSEAGGRTSDGSVKLSESFVSKATESVRVKLVAPDFVQPSGKLRVDESLSKLRENGERLEKLRQSFESFDGTGATFPHPAFGPMTAQDWLVLCGGHQDRHRRQIKAHLKKLAG
ncbi:MAG: DinB family protein [Blastocatellia bacterium]|nr:DinB family protein [Blastocatellia bacterium]